MALTKKQSLVLNFLTQFIQTHGYSPSYEEIATGIGTRSKGSISKHIHALVEQGFLSKGAEKSRSLKLAKPLHSSEDAPGLPFVGKIAAGRPIMAFENIDKLDLNHYLASSTQRCFLLEVVGESMIGCGILEGDLVLIQSQPTAHNGQIVVALVDGFEATLKRYRKNPNHTIDLIPENPNMQTMTFEADRVLIQGILIAQIRRYP